MSAASLFFSRRTKVKSGIRHYRRRLICRGYYFAAPAPPEFNAQGTLQAVGQPAAEEGKLLGRLAALFAKSSPSASPQTIATKH